MREKIQQLYEKRIMLYAKNTTIGHKPPVIRITIVTKQTITLLYWEQNKLLYCYTNMTIGKKQTVIRAQQ